MTSPMIGAAAVLPARPSTGASARGTKGSSAAGDDFEAALNGVTSGDGIDATDATNATNATAAPPAAQTDDTDVSDGAASDAPAADAGTVGADLLALGAGVITMPLFRFDAAVTGTGSGTAADAVAGPTPIAAGVAGGLPVAGASPAPDAQLATLVSDLNLPQAAVPAPAGGPVAPAAGTPDATGPAIPLPPGAVLVQNAQPATPTVPVAAPARPATMGDATTPATDPDTAPGTVETSTDGAPRTPDATTAPATVTAPATPRAEAAAQAAEPAPAPASPAATAAQLSTRIAPLRTSPDGVHHMTIHLNPAELGPISVVAHVRAGELAVQLSGATEVGREAMRAALPQLEKELRDSGYSSCTLDVSQDAPRQDLSNRPQWSFGGGRSGGDGSPNGGGHGQDRRAGGGRDEVRVATTAARRAASGSLDLHV